MWRHIAIFSSSLRLSEHPVERPVDVVGTDRLAMQEQLCAMLDPAVIVAIEAAYAISSLFYEAAIGGNNYGLQFRIGSLTSVML